jgi:hypothetical protein
LVKTLLPTTPGDHLLLSWRTSFSLVVCFTRLAHQKMSDSVTMRLLADAAAEGENEFGVHISYQDLFHSIVFLSLIYASGMLVSRFASMPALVGEIFMGILLGPNALNFVPNTEAFVMLGEIG